MKRSRRRFLGVLAAAPVACAVGSVDQAAVVANERPSWRLRPVAKTKVFDPSDRTGFGTVTNIDVFTDATLMKRDGRWTLMGGVSTAAGRLSIASASLPEGAPLSATGWRIDAVPGDPTVAALLVPDPALEAWDGRGGRHCASHVRGWDPGADGGRGAWEERIYYAGANPRFGGPYSIGYVVWDGTAWVVPDDVPQPVMTATEPWENPDGRYGGVYEPNLIYHRGSWRMWYVAGPPDAHGQMPHGYAESVDGRTGWRKKVYWPAEQDVFDNAVIASPKPGQVHGRGRGLETVFSRFALSFQPEDDWGIWWHRAARLHDTPERWGEPVQIVRANDGSQWHALGVWKPTIAYSDTDPERAFVFFDGGFLDGGRPNYTTGCVECEIVRV